MHAVRGVRSGRETARYHTGLEPEGFFIYLISCMLSSTRDIESGEGCDDVHGTLNRGITPSCTPSVGVISWRRVSVLILLQRSTQAHTSRKESSDGNSPGYAQEIFQQGCLMQSSDRSRAQASHQKAITSTTLRSITSYSVAWSS